MVGHLFKQNRNISQERQNQDAGSSVVGTPTRMQGPPWLVPQLSVEDWGKGRVKIFFVNKEKGLDYRSLLSRRRKRTDSFVARPAYPEGSQRGSSPSTRTIAESTTQTHLLGVSEGLCFGTGNMAVTPDLS